MVSIFKKTLRAGIWQFISIMTRAIMQLLIMGILSRLVNSQSFGYIAIMNTILIFIEMFSEAGIGAKIIQKDRISEKFIRSCNTASLTLGCIYFVALFLFAPSISYFFKDPNLIPIIRLMSLSILITKIGVIPKALLEREHNFKCIMKIELCSYLLGYCTVALVLAFNNYQAYSIVFALLAQYIIQSVLLNLAKRTSVKLSFDRDDFREIIIWGSGLTLSNLFNNIANQGDYLVVGRMLGMDLLGVYERAFNIMHLPGRYLGLTLEKVLFPTFSKLKTEKSRIKIYYLNSIKIINLILAPLSIYMIFVAKDLIIVLLGERWVNAQIPLCILLVTLNLRTITKISNALVSAEGLVYRSAYRKLVYAITVVVGCICLYKFNLVGIAIAVNISVVLNYILMSDLVKDILCCKLREMFTILIPGIVISLLIFIILIPLKGMIYLKVYNVILRLIIITVIFSISFFILIMTYLIINYKNTLEQSITLIKSKIDKNKRSNYGV